MQLSFRVPVESSGKISNRSLRWYVWPVVTVNVIEVDVLVGLTEEFDVSVTSQLVGTKATLPFVGVIVIVREPAVAL
jgi:hypothetical protein